MKYLDIQTGKVVAIYPWTDATMKRVIKDTKRFMPLIEE